VGTALSPPLLDPPEQELKNHTKPMAKRERDLSFMDRPIKYYSPIVNEIFKDMGKRG
jgi:hypothetical protein